MLQQNKLAAPISYGKQCNDEEKECFTSLKFQEKKFTDKFGEDIPSDYLLRFETMLRDVNTWITDIKSRGNTRFIQIKKFQSPIIVFFLNIELKKDYSNLIYQNTLTMDYIVIRPCAEGNGFYRFLLWNLRNFAIAHDFDVFKIIVVLPYNRSILQNLGFTITYFDREDKYDAELTRDALLSVTKEAWGVPDSFPTSDELNSERFVDRRAMEEYSLGPGTRSRFALTNLAAPIPRYRVYAPDEQAVLVSPAFQEHQFAQEFGDDIPFEYIAELMRENNRAKSWIHNILDNGEKNTLHSNDFATNVIKYSLEIMKTNEGRSSKEKNILTLKNIIIRPCAENSDSLKFLMWDVKFWVKNNNIHLLRIANALTECRSILKNLNFHFTFDSVNHHYNAEMTKEELVGLTKSDWNIHGFNMPVYHELNDPKWSNTCRRN